jgi:trehalose 6-phosphate phosphatase
MRRLAATLGQIAVISGRPAADVVRLGDLEPVPGLRVLGHYGLQTWQDGELSSPAPDPGVEVARQRLPGLLANAPNGVYVEDKLHSVVVHTRPSADPQGVLDELTPALWELAAATGLEAVAGKYVLELRPPGVDKGSALRELVASVEARTVVYVGDDVGDLPAFRAVVAMREAGQIEGLAVAAVAPDATDVPPDLRDAADLVLPGPDGVVAWLSGIAAMLPA